MALPDYFKAENGTAKTAKSSGGDSTITLASLANGSARQGAKIDLGATRDEEWAVRLAVEMAATPTAGNTVDVWWAPSSSATAGTDNPGNVTGTDAAYAGYSSNLDATLPQLQYVGSLVLTAQATATVQVGEVGRFKPNDRYGSPVIVNRGGSAFHSSDSNIVLTMRPIKASVED